MRLRRFIPFVAAAAVLAIFLAVIAFSWSPHTIRKPAEAMAAYDVVSPPMLSVAAPADVAPPAVAPPGVAPVDAPVPIAVSVPRLAYAYALAFRLPDDRIATAQETHRRLCERMGPAQCQLVAMQRGAADGTQGQANLKLRVASDRARAFSDALIQVVAQAGGRAIATSVTADDVSKDMVDTEARIRQRELLVSRLTEILRNRNGKVAELVEAERSVAGAQEELDQAKGWLAELRGRVAMADLTVTYAAVAPQTSPRVAGSQLAEAVQGSGAAFLATLRAVLTMTIYLAPWLLILLPVALLARRHARRRSRDEADCTPAPLPV